MFILFLVMIKEDGLGFTKFGFGSFWSDSRNCCIIAWYMQHYHAYDKSGFHTFIAILTGLGVFVTFMFYYNVVELQNQQQQLAALQELTRINDGLQNNVLKGIMVASNTIPYFVLSITPLNAASCCGSCILEPDPVTPQTCTEKMTLSYKIFSLWQDVLVSNKFISFDPVTYITGFLEQANSQLLFEQWVLVRNTFTPRTQTFGDLLFKYGLPITIQTPETYAHAAVLLMADPVFSTL
jgi:hypothetical protein